MKVPDEQCKTDAKLTHRFCILSVQTFPGLKEDRPTRCPANCNNYLYFQPQHVNGTAFASGFM